MQFTFFYKQIILAANAHFLVKALTKMFSLESNKYEISINSKKKTQKHKIPNKTYKDIRVAFYGEGTLF